VMLFWLSSTGDPEFVVNVGTGICSLAIFTASIVISSSANCAVQWWLPTGLENQKP
jgi:hypothetical protein